jgi:hypothetical protein
MTHYGIGPRQRKIGEAMEKGWSLEKTGLGHFWLIKDGKMERVSDISCQGLRHRGLIKVAETKEDTRFIGGVHYWYELTEQGKAALK